MRNFIQHNFIASWYLQERFLLKDDEESEQKWFVPLTWTTQSEAPAGFQSTEPKDWLHPTDTSKELNIEISPEEWIIFNNQETGVSIMVLSDGIVLLGGKICYDGKESNQLVESLSHQAKASYTERTTEMGQCISATSKDSFQICSSRLSFPSYMFIYSNGPPLLTELINNRHVKMHNV